MIDHVHRCVLPGRMDFLLEAQQAYADYMYLNTPGVLAITAGLDEHDPNLLHDFQVIDIVVIVIKILIVITIKAG